MKIIFSNQFDKDLENILNFIAKDSLQRAIEFNTNLYEKIKKISDMPYRFRKNKNINRENIRDLIFKGYIIPFSINNDTDTIEILAIFKHNITPYSDFK